MASTYSPLKIELIATGEQSSTWGVTTNNNLGTALGEAITGSADVDFSSAADVTVTLTDTNGAQTARNLRLNITESGAGIGYVGNLILGSGCQIEKLYLINNTSTAAKTIKNTAGTGISVPAGKSMFVYNNGTNVVDAVNYFSGTVAITGGTINSTPIGGTTPSTVAGTTGTFSGFVGTAATGALITPVGTTAQQPAGTAGMLRLNTSTTPATFEGYNGTAWGSIGGGATGAGGDTVFQENSLIVTTSYTLSTGKSAMSVGPITINGGAAVTIPSGYSWLVL
jgi:hypothetical protein